MNFLDKRSEKEIRDAIASSTTFTEALIKLKCSANDGCNRKVFTQYIKDHNIDVSHFKKGRKRQSTLDIFIENSLVSQSVLRTHYSKENYSPYECAICGQEPFWNGKPLVLTLDHINGTNNDNRLENLRWICPNCDRQLTTYGSKRKKQNHRCDVCGKEIDGISKYNLCFDCYWKKRRDGSDLEQHLNQRHKRNDIDLCPRCGEQKRKSAELCLQCANEDRRQKAITKREENYNITRESLKNDLRQIPIAQIANKYYVASSTICAWCKTYRLPHRVSEIQSYSDDDWAAI